MSQPSPIPPTPGPTIARLVREATDHLATYFASLRREQWDLPSAAQGWSLADVFAHVSGSAPRYASYIRRAAQGNTSPPPGTSQVKPYQEPRVSQGIAQRARDQREQAGEELLRAFRDDCADLQQTLDSLQPKDWEKPCFHRIMTVPIRELALTRLAEVCLHTWDMKASLEPWPALEPPQVVPVVVEWLSTWFSWGFYPQQPQDPPLRYRFQVCEPRLVTWDVVVRGDRFQIESPSGVATVTFTADPGTTLLVFAGRVPWRQAQEAGRLAVDGDSAPADAFFQWFRGV